MDLQLGRGTGFEVLQSVSGEKIPLIIVLTNYALEPYRQKALDLGADGFYDKSSDIPKVMDVLEEFGNYLR